MENIAGFSDTSPFCWKTDKSKARIGSCGGQNPTIFPVCYESLPQHGDNNNYCRTTLLSSQVFIQNTPYYIIAHNTSLRPQRLGRDDYTYTIVRLGRDECKKKERNLVKVFGNTRMTLNTFYCLTYYYFRPNY